MEWIAIKTQTSKQPLECTDFLIQRFFYMFVHISKFEILDFDEKNASFINASDFKDIHPKIWKAIQAIVKCFPNDK